MSRPYSGGVVVAEVVRSDFVECRHRGSIAVLDAEGRPLASAGDPHGPVFPRSANKPMQAVGMLTSGLSLADSADLALVAASHWGEPMHVERIRTMLRVHGLSEDDLRCPPALPLSETACEELLRTGGGPARVLMNCSGKHAGMLLTCLAAGWPVEGYRDPDHPVQKACRVAVEELSGEPVAAVGVDGCGAAVLAVSLTGLARAFLRLVSAEPGTPERMVADAMRRHPELVSGTGADDAVVMRAVPGLLSKVGAEGVVAVAVPGIGAAAVKIDDGAARARLPVLISALRRLGIDIRELAGLAEVAVLGGGARVGSIRAVPALLAAGRPGP